MKGIKLEGVVRKRFRGDGLIDRSIIYVSYVILKKKLSIYWLFFTMLMEKLN